MSQAATIRTTPVTIDHLAGEATKLVAAGEITALVGLFDAYLHALESLMGFVGQPRFENTIAADLLDGEIARFDDLAEAVVVKLRDAKPANLIEKQVRADTLVRWAFHIGENLETIMVVLAEAMAISERKPH